MKFTLLICVFISYQLYLSRLKLVAIEWFFITNDELESFEEAATRIRWYLCRWQIEIFFKI
ncbi:MAG TPA: hypothetical protein ENJ51_07680 [Leucothrix mucor]|uniref:Transposase n=1 Tax=Leucothrix mucor TaxID=45248 RepID=A0A7V2WV34_LEUMU|nr:hypothetical protein [Leucothrix mucor]